MPVLDNLERALKDDESNDLRAQLGPRLRGSEAPLAGLGLRPIDMASALDSRGAAVGTEHAAGVDDDAGVTPTRRGLLLDDELLRFAQVVVTKPK